MEECSDSCLLLFLASCGAQEGALLAMLGQAEKKKHIERNF